MKKAETLNLIIILLLVSIILFQAFDRYYADKRSRTASIHKEYDACVYCTAQESKNWQQAMKNVRADF